LTLSAAARFSAIHPCCCQSFYKVNPRFNTKKVWLQTLPISRLASRIVSYGGSRRKEEGSVLGGLGNLLDGD